MGGGAPAWGESISLNTSSGGKAKIYELNRCHEKPNDEVCREILNSLMREGGGDKCEEAKKDFKKIATEFASACGTAGIPSAADSKTGDIACARTLLKCDCRFPNPAAGLNCSADDASSENRGPTSDEFYSQQMGITGLKNLRALDREAKYCPVLSSRDLEKFEKQVTEARKKVKDLEEKIPKIQESANEIQSSTEEKLTTLRKQMADNQTNGAKQVRDTTRAHEATIGQLEEKITTLSGQLDKLEDGKMQLELNATQAEVQMGEAKTQIELNCHASATAKVAQDQAERLSEEKAGKLNRGGFEKMVSLSGMSDRKAWQVRAKPFYEECLASAPTKASKNSANQIYKSALRQKAVSRSSLEKQEAAVENQIKRIKSPNGGCTVFGSSGEQTEMCKAVAKVGEDIQQIQMDTALAAQQLQEQYNKTTQEGARKYALKQQEFFKAQQEITEEKIRLANLEQAYAIKNQASGGASVDAKEVSAAFSKFSALKAAALHTASSCKAADCDETCKNAKNFLNEMQTSSNYNIDGSDIAPPPTGTATQGTAATDGSSNATPASREPAAAPAAPAAGSDADKAGEDPTKSRANR